MKGKFNGNGLQGFILLAAFIAVFTIESKFCQDGKGYDSYRSGGMSMRGGY